MRIGFRRYVRTVALGVLFLGAAVSGQALPDGGETSSALPQAKHQADNDYMQTAQTARKIDPDRWHDLIDTTWGQGPPTAEKLQVFDAAWTELDERYGAFMNLEVDLLALRNRYRTEIAGGVRQGRFAAILNHLSLAMKDSHTAIMHRQVNWNTEPRPGVPLFVVSAWLGTWFFGASLTPLPDDTLLVIRVLPDHPLRVQVPRVQLDFR